MSSLNKTVTTFCTVLLLTLVAACGSGPSNQEATEATSASLPPQSPADEEASASGAQAASDENTFDEETVVEEATDFLGAGAKEIASVIEGLFASYGRPNAYIAGSEAGGAFVVGLRYGGGTLKHKIEGSYPIHWTGPSVGF